jgi:segregation and condensation protein A
MTSNDAPSPGARAGRRRALGRGPGEQVAPPGPPVPEAPGEARSGTESREPAAAPAAPPSRAPESTASGTSSWSDATSPETPRTATAREEGSARPESGARHESPTLASPRPPAAPPGSGTQTSTAASRTAQPTPAAPPGTAPQAPAVAATAPASGRGPARRETVPQGAAAPGGAVAGPEAAESPAAAASPASVASQAPPQGAPERPAEEAPEDGGDGVFKVRLANFEGPFDLLLQLISKHKMDVTEVALSKVTDEFMAHIRAMGPDWDLDETTEFLVVAATLLDLKAARLLPAAEVEDEADLALLEARDLLFARLLQYRAYKQIAEIFNERLEAEARRYPRTVGLEPHHAELLPEVVISIGPEGFARLAVKAMQPRPKPQVYVEHIHAPLVSVQEQAGIVVARLKELGEASFRVLVQDTEDTLTVVARFLALLELYREKAVELDQERALGDLLVRWTGGAGEAGPVVTDEFDRPPEETEEERKA